MPDICMCGQDACPKHETCYRFTATPSEYRQAYCAFEFNEKGCEFYWPVKEEDE